MANHCSYSIKTPVGWIGLTYRAEPFRLSRIELSAGGGKTGGRGMHSPPPPDGAVFFCRLINDYFDHRAIAIPWQLLDLDHLSVLQQKVLHETAKISPGSCKPYEDIAIAIGRPRASRFVGSALAKNPFPLLIPCHRVVRKDGNIGNFGGGKAMKKWLLAFEAENYGASGLAQNLTRC